MTTQSPTRTIEKRVNSFTNVKQTVNPDLKSSENGFGILKEARIEQNTDKYPSYSTDEVIVFDIDCGGNEGILVIPSNPDARQYTDLLQWAGCESIEGLCERETPVNRYNEHIYTVPSYISSGLPTTQIKEFSKQNFEEMYDFENDTWNFGKIDDIEERCSRLLLLELTVGSSIVLAALTSLSIIMVMFCSAVLSIVLMGVTLSTSLFSKISSVYCDKFVLR